MAELNQNSCRPWRVIADEVSREYDPRKLTRLLKELNNAMEEQVNRKVDHSNDQGRAGSTR